MSEKSITVVSKTNYDAGMALKQNITDNTLTTTSKTIPGSINELHDDVINKLDVLVSGTNIKTVNGNSLLGSGNLIFLTTSDDALS